MSATLAAFNAAAQADTRPNIIFILTDDQAFDLIGVYGNELIKTPNLDRIANEGVRFTNGYTSSAVSKPSRTCILTGMYERRHGINFGSGTALGESAWAKCYPVLLRESGYYTGYLGKNHTPIGVGGYESGLMESSYDYWYGNPGGTKFYPKDFFEIYKGSKYTTQPEVMCEGALDFLNPERRELTGPITYDDRRDTSKPFFLNICVNSPHNAATSSMKMRESDPELYRTTYRDLDIPLSPLYVAKEDIKEHKLPTDLYQHHRRQANYKYVETPVTNIEIRTRQMQLVSGIDKMLGNILDELKRQKIEDNTIIIFSTDNGLFSGEWGYAGKGTCYQLNTNVPFIIYDPTSKQSHKTVNDELVLLLDVAPTILDYAGVEIPSDYQGFSLVPMLKNKEKSVRDYLFTENLWVTNAGNPRIEAVQDKEWKYIRYYKNDLPQTIDKQSEYLKDINVDNGIYKRVTQDMIWRYRSFVEAPFEGEKAIYEELYNIKKDQFEEINLINDKRYTKLLDKMKAECDKALKMDRGEGFIDVVSFVPGIDYRRDGVRKVISSKEDLAAKQNLRGVLFSPDF